MNKIKIQFEYDQKTSTIEVEVYKQVSILYEKVESLFFPLNIVQEGKLLTYNNKDIFQYSQNLIGEIFKNKSKIMIKVVDNIKKIDIKPNLKEEKKFSELFSPEDDYLQAKRIKVDAKDSSKESSKKEKINLEILKCSCKSAENINFYCRKCKDYLCKNCRYSSDHINHKTIFIDLSKQLYLEESVKLYCMNVQADAGICFKSFEGYNQILKDIKLFDYSTKKQTLLKKIEDFDSKINQLKAVLPKLDTPDKIMSDIEAANKKLTIEIGTILVEVDKIKNKKLDILGASKTISKPDKIEPNLKEKKEMLKRSDEEIFDLLENVSNLESDIEELSVKSISFKLNYDIHKKIEEMYDNIIKSLDANVFSQKYDFSLDLDVKEMKVIPCEVTNLMRQTANSKGNVASTSISNLIHLSKNFQMEMDEERNFIKDKPKESKSKEKPDKKLKNK